MFNELMDDISNCVVTFSFVRVSESKVVLQMFAKWILCICKKRATVAAAILWVKY